MIILKWLCSVSLENKHLLLKCTKQKGHEFIPVLTVCPNITISINHYQKPIAVKGYMGGDLVKGEALKISEIL